MDSADLAPTLIAAAALVVALGALTINLREHREFMRRLRARARFDVKVRTVDADEDGIRWTDATTQITRVAIGVKNNGERAAGETLVNVVVPRTLPYARWAGPQGEELPDDKGTAHTAELLPDEHGNETIESKYVSTTWPRVGTRSHYEKYVTFP